MAEFEAKKCKLRQFNTCVYIYTRLPPHPANALVHRPTLLEYVVSLKAFPDELFHQLLFAMTHPDHETRVGGHSTLCMVLTPSVVSHGLNPKVKLSGDAAEPIDGLWEEVSQISDVPVKKSGQSDSFKGALVAVRTELTPLRLSGHQMSLSLSACSVQKTPCKF